MQPNPAPQQDHIAAPPTLHLLTLLALWVVIFFAAIFAPPLLDDADATHAQAAQAMATTGDWVTLHVNGIRYLEKPPLPYWLVAVSFRIFGFNTFAVHLPIALAVLGLSLLGYSWARRAFGCRAALYTGTATLTCTGVFLFTRIFIPEALLSLFLCAALYSFLRALDTGSNSGALPSPPPSQQGWVYAYVLWSALALAVLTKGLIALVFFFGTATLYLALTGDHKNWRRLRPFSGLLLFIAIAAPWHILASLRNTGGENGHGFAWFYFINEHVLRFLGRRLPRDYNKLPGYLYWSLHIVWLFPWSLFAPAAAILGWRKWKRDRLMAKTQATRSILLLTLYSVLILAFFSLSTNQEYYTFPVYLPLLMLLCAGLARAEAGYDFDAVLRRCLVFAHAAYTAIGLAASAALAYGLWSSRNLAFVPDIGDLLAHRGVGDYTLSMSHFFDLTGPSFAALRLPAALALIALAVGPATAWFLRARRKHVLSTLTVALTSALFLIAAHVALGRFAPMLSSKDFADKIEELADDKLIDRDNDVLLFGDQSFGSSIPFYLEERVELVEGRSSSMLFGSTFPDAPHLFLTVDDLTANWGRGRRKILFVPQEKRAEFERIPRLPYTVLEETSGKLLITDRPLKQLH